MCSSDADHPIILHVVIHTVKNFFFLFCRPICMSSDARKIAARTPVTINHSWLDCITEYVENHPTTRLHPSIEIIRTFINDIEATWEKQRGYLKKIGKL